MLTREQLQERKTGVGASESGAVLGVDRFASPYSIYVDKVDEEIVERTSNPMIAGQWLEAAVADWAADRYGWRLHRSNRTLRHKDFPWLLASVDRFRVTETGKRLGIVEIKTTRDFGDIWGPEGSDEVPDSYRIQVQQQMLVTGLREAHLVALSMLSRELRCFSIPHSDELAQAIVDGVGHFWQEHVLKRVPPPVDGSAVCTEALERFFKTAGEELVEAPQEAEEYARGYLDATRQARVAEDAKKAAGNYLRFWIGEHKGIVGPGWKATWTEQKGRVNQKALIETLAGLAGLGDDALAEISEANRGKPSRVLRVTETKGK